MPKFVGQIGFITQSETAPGIWEDYITEKIYKGDIIQNARRWVSSEKITDDFTIDNRISILADAFLYNNFPAIKYVKWMGTRWKITNIELVRPRLNLTLGGIYNGPTI